MTARFISNPFKRSGRSAFPQTQFLAVALVSLLMLYPAWLRGGTHAAWTWPLPWIAIGGLFLWLLSGRIGGECANRPVLSLKDPVFWAGLLFLLLLVLQWWNAGRALYYDVAARAWSYSPPRHPLLPSAITTAEARQMLDWFVPAWVILVVLRSPSLWPRARRAIWRVAVINAALLAIFGMVQFASGTTNMYWLIPMRPHFFASFGYPNHAGSYFLMSECLAAALLVYELEDTTGRKRLGRILVLSLAFLLSLVGANFALSRASILLSWLLVLPVGFVFGRVIWRRLRPAHRVNLIIGSLAAIVLAALLTIGLGRDAIRTEFKPEDDQKTFFDRETNFRLFQLETAFQIWRDHPLYGVGGWGYRYLMAHYLPTDQWHRVSEGKANVHNDPVQFLCEFGAVGAGAMTGVVVLLGCSVFRRRQDFDAMIALSMLGVGAVALQSLIDLPFRSPAVLYLWLVILAGAGGARKSKQPADNSSNQLNERDPGDIVLSQRNTQ